MRSLFMIALIALWGMIIIEFHVSSLVVAALILVAIIVLGVAVIKITAYLYDSRYKRKRRITHGAAL